TEEAGDETAAANFSARFKSTKDLKQLTPRGQHRFARQQFAEDHAIASQKHTAGSFDGRCPFNGVGTEEQRPTPCIASWTQRTKVASIFNAPSRIDQRTKIIETISGEQSGGDQFPQRCFYLGLGLSGPTNNIGKKEGTASF